MIIVQLIGALFGLFLAYYTFVHYKRKEFGLGTYLMWSGIWLLFVIVSLFPSVLSPIVESLNFARPLDFLTVVGFLLLVGISFYTYITTMKLETKVENLVRKIAIEKAKKK